VKNLHNCRSFKGTSGKNFVDPMVYKEYLIKSQQRKAVNHQVLGAQNLTSAGATRHSDSVVDSLVITRIINRLELVFGHDRTKFWKLSKQSECFVCDQHKYTVIFYDKISENEGFVKISDEAAINSIK
jgi:hypothetical protein